MGQQQQFSSGNKRKKLNVHSNQTLLWFPMDSTCKTQHTDQTNHHMRKADSLTILNVKKKVPNAKTHETLWLLLNLSRFSGCH